MSSAIPRGFRGLRWEPTNEQEVVVLFGRLLDRLDRPLAIDSVGTTFPDCKATDSETGETICIEFELYSSHFFRDHANGNRRPERCDWVVCWHNDLAGERSPGWPRIVALDEILDSASGSHILNRRPANATRAEAFKFRIAGSSPRHQEIVRQLMEFGEAQAELEISWPETNRDCFTVREPRGIEYFKVGSSSITVPFSRWSAVSPEVKRDIAEQLNAALGTKWFTGEGKTKRDTAELMGDDESVRRFISVWRDFAGLRANKRMEPTR